LEGAGHAAGAHRSGHGRGYVERPARPSPAVDRAAHRGPDTGGRAVAVLHRRVVRVAGDDGHPAGGRAVADRRPADAVQRSQLVRGRHDRGRAAHSQIRHGRRRHGSGRHTGSALLRDRRGQRGIRGRVRIVHRHRTDRARFRVLVRPRRCAAVVPGRRLGRQPVGRVPQLLPRVGQTSSRPRQADPVSDVVCVRAAHVHDNRR